MQYETTVCCNYVLQTEYNSYKYQFSKNLFRQHPVGGISAPCMWD